MRHRPVHRLHRLDISVTFDEEGPYAPCVLHVDGRSRTKRTALWHYAEVFTAEVQQDRGYSLNDAVAHIVLVCHQDRPNTLERLKFGLSGGVYWDEPQLPF